MVKLSTIISGVGGISMLVPGSVYAEQNQQEKIKKSFDYLGEKYEISGDIITKRVLDDNTTEVMYDGKNPNAIFRKDGNEWYFDENRNGAKDSGEKNMTNDFVIRAYRAQNLEKLMTFEAPSKRPGYEGKIFKYDFWSDGTVSREDEPSTTFYPKWKYDSNTKITSMSDTFNEKANNTIINDVIGNLIKDYKASQEDNSRLQKEKEKLTNIANHVDSNGRGNIAFIVDTLMGDGFKSGLVGTGIHYNLSDKLAFAGTVFAGATKDEAENDRVDWPDGTYGETSTELLDQNLVGGSLEIILGDKLTFMMGLDVTKTGYTEKIVEAIKNSKEETLASTSNSATGSDISLGFRAGIGLNDILDSGISIMPLMRLDTETKNLSFGLRGMYRWK